MLFNLIIIIIMVHAKEGKQRHLANSGRTHMDVLIATSFQDHADGLLCQLHPVGWLDQVL